MFEDRSAKTGRKIALNLILLPASSAKPAADATFYLVGGPGAAATAAATNSFMSQAAEGARRCAGGSARHGRVKSPGL